MNRWFPAPTGSSAAAVRLYCLPHAGAGGSTYRPWVRRLPAAVEAVPVQLPGRESRFGEPAATSAAELVDQLTEPMLAHVPDRYALFGHSMGALVAFELAHALTRHGRPPAHLVVSGYAAPQLPPRTVDPPVHQLSDDDLCAHLTGLDGTPDGVLAASEVLRALLPTMRADFAVCETYRYIPREPLPAAISALGGATDPDTSQRKLEAWRDLTSREFTVDCFPGGHFYLLDQPETVIDTVAARLLYSISGRSES